MGERSGGSYERCPKCNDYWLAGYVTCPACGRSLLGRLAAATGAARGRRGVGVTGAWAARSAAGAVELRGAAWSPSGNGDARPDAAAAPWPTGRASAAGGRYPTSEPRGTVRTPSDLLTPGRTGQSTAVEDPAAAAEGRQIARTRGRWPGTADGASDDPGRAGTGRWYPWIWSGGVAVVLAVAFLFAPSRAATSSGGASLMAQLPGSPAAAAPGPTAASQSSGGSGALGATAPIGAGTAATPGTLRLVRIGGAGATNQATAGGSSVVAPALALWTSLTARPADPAVRDYVRYIGERNAQLGTAFARIDTHLQQADRDTSLRASPEWQDGLDAALRELKSVGERWQQPYQPAVPADFAAFHRDFAGCGALIAEYATTVLSAREESDPQRADQLFAQASAKLDSLDPMLDQLDTRLQELLRHYRF